MAEELFPTILVHHASCIMHHRSLLDKLHSLIVRPSRSSMNVGLNAFDGTFIAEINLLIR